MYRKIYPLATMAKGKYLCKFTINRSEIKTTFTVGRSRSLALAGETLRGLTIVRAYWDHSQTMNSFCTLVNALEFHAASARFLKHQPTLFLWMGNVHRLMALFLYALRELCNDSFYCCLMQTLHRVDPRLNRVNTILLSFICMVVAVCTVSGIDKLWLFFPLWLSSDPSHLGKQIQTRLSSRSSRATHPIEVDEAGFLSGSRIVCYRHGGYAIGDPGCGVEGCNNRTYQRRSIRCHP